MQTTPTDRRLLAWLLYFSVLFSALACSIGHGQMAGLQLSGLDGLYCGSQAGATLASESAADGAPAATLLTAGCALCSTFSALILAALFGLLGLLRLAALRPNPLLLAAGLPVRYLWPSANPRASPVI